MPPSDEPLLREPGVLPAELRLGLERLRDKRPSAERMAAMAAAVGLTASASSASAASTADGGSAASSTANAGVLASPVGKLLLAGGFVVAGAVALLSLRPSAAPSGTPDPRAASAVTPATAPASERGVRAPAEQSGAVSVSSPTGPPAASGALPASVGAPATPGSSATAAAPSAANAPSAPANVRPRGIPEDSALATTSTPPPSNERAPAPRSDPRGAPAGAGARVAESRATEAELLRDARQVLDRNPLVALSLCEEHQRAYPGGGLTQERELIAITALLRLGRTSSAEARAARFRTSFPRSAYLPRLDRLVPP